MENILQEISKNELVLENSKYRLLPVNYTNEEIFDELESLIETIKELCKYVQNSSEMLPISDLRIIDSQNRIKQYKELLNEAGFVETDGLLKLQSSSTSKGEAKRHANSLGKLRDSLIKLAEMVPPEKRQKKKRLVNEGKEEKEMLASYVVVDSSKSDECPSIEVIDEPISLQANITLTFVEPKNEVIKPKSLIDHLVSIQTDTFHRIQKNYLALVNSQYNFLPLNFTAESIIEQKEQILENLRIVLKYVENTCSKNPDENLFVIKEGDAMMKYKEILVYDVGYTETNGCLEFNQNDSAVTARNFYEDQHGSFVELISLIEKLEVKRDDATPSLKAEEHPVEDPPVKKDESVDAVVAVPVITSNEFNNQDLLNQKAKEKSSSGDDSPQEKSEIFERIKKNCFVSSNDVYKFLPLNFSQASLVSEQSAILTQLSEVRDYIQNTCSKSPNKNFFLIRPDHRMMRYKELLVYDVGYIENNDSLEFSPDDVSAKAQAKCFYRDQIKDFDELVELIKLLKPEKKAEESATSLINQEAVPIIKCEERKKDDQSSAFTTVEQRTVSSAKFEKHQDSITAQKSTISAIASETKGESHNNKNTSSTNVQQSTVSSTKCEERKKDDKIPAYTPVEQSTVSKLASETKGESHNNQNTSSTMAQSSAVSINSNIESLKQCPKCTQICKNSVMQCDRCGRNF